MVMRFAYIVGFFMVVLLIATPEFAKSEQIYTCPMHPHIVSDIEGTCPICGMDLVPLGNDEGISNDNMHNHETSDDDERISIKISPETIQNIGVRTEKATLSEFGTHIRSYGIITPNERLQKKIYSRVEGWITELGVSAIGDNVKNGDHIYTIHSPDLMLAQQDLLSLERSGRNTGLNKLFIHYQVDKKLVQELRKTKSVKENIPYYSSYSGTVSELNVRPGSYVTLDTPLIVLEDYSSVWINVSIAEKDLQFIAKNSKAIITFPNLGGAEHIGNVDYIYPTIDTGSRTGQVRLVLDNNDGTLKPGAYADIAFETNVEKRLSIPSEAILKSIDGDFVILSKGNGQFQPVKIKTGITNKGYSEVISGIKSGDNIVVSSQFMIDSESSLREAFRKMKKPAGDSHAGH